MSQYKMVVTNAGKSAIADAIANGTTVKLAHFAVGDGDGFSYTPDVTMIKLVKERWRGRIEQVAAEQNNQRKIVATIPSDVGGFFMREIGVFDEHGVLIAVGNTAVQYKPNPNEGMAKAIKLGLIIKVDNADAIELIVYEDIQAATKQDITAVRTEINGYKNANDLVVNNTVNRVTTLENNKAEKTYVDNRLIGKADKVDTYTKTETDTRIQAVIDVAPEALDTLKEIADALNNDPDFAATMTNELSKKVDKVAGKQLSTEDFTSAEKNKLANIEAGANKYIHPTTHPATMIEQDPLHRLVTDDEKSGWNNKAEKLHVHTWDEIKDKPSSLPASGGDADTVDGIHANGFARAYSADYTFGGDQTAMTTDEFIALLTSLGAFAQPYWVARGSWFYAGNRYISDTGIGSIHLAGCTVEVMGNSSNYTIRIHTPTTSAAGAVNTEYIYVNNGWDYAPGWRKIWNDKNDGAGSGLDADLLDGKHASEFANVSHTHDIVTNKPENFRDASALPSAYEMGQTIFFSNSPANKFNGVYYCTIVTIRGYSGFANCVQFIYPYNVDAPITYRYSLYANDAWGEWRKLSIEGHSHVWSEITDKPTSLPANGGNANTVNGKHAAATPATTEKNDIIGMINEVFTSASEAKRLIVNAINNKGGTATINDTFATLADEIGRISTGKKWASGQTNAANGTITVTGLSFTPTCVIFDYPNSQLGGGLSTLYPELNRYNVLSIGLNGFTLKSFQVGLIRWIAYE